MMCIENINRGSEIEKWNSVIAGEFSCGRHFPNNYVIMLDPNLDWLALNDNSLR